MLLNKKRREKLAFALLFPVLLAIGYLLVTGLNFFTPKPTLLALGANFFKFQNVLIYYLVHSWYHHLFFNAAVLFAFGYVIYEVLGKKHFISLFFVSTVGSALAAVLIFPGYSFVGASAASSAWVAVAFASRPKQAIAALIASSVLVSILLSPIAALSYAASLESLSQERETLELDYNAAIIAGDVNRARAVYIMIERTEQVIEKTVEEEKSAKGLDISHFMHAIGAVIGLGYLLVFRKAELIKGIESVHNVLVFIGIKR